jgi:DNA-binding CsgD family transcriptional regulator
MATGSVIWGMEVVEQVTMLTERERQCLRLVHSHFNSKQIARELGIKPGTVDRHCENAARKLNVDSRVAAALVLVAREGVPNGSQYERVAIAPTPVAALDGGAERTPHDPDGRYASADQLARNGDHSSGNGDLRHQASDGASLDRGNAQAGRVSDSGRRSDGTRLHHSSHAGRELLSDHIGIGRLGSLLVVFGVAAAAVWIVTAIAGAERFAFLLQDLRYGG